MKVIAANGALELARSAVRSARFLTGVSGIAGFLVAAMTASPASDGVATVARPAPAFLLETPDGSELSLRSYAGRPLVLNVFASWCPPCRRELPRIVSAARHAGSRIAFLGVDAQEPVHIASAFAKEMQLPYPIAIDHGQFAASYGARSLPETIFVDAHGIVRAIVHGTISEQTLEGNLALIAPANRSANS